MAWGPIAAVGAGVVGSLFNKGKGTTITQGPLETEEQRKARQKLLGMAEGNLGYGGPLGAYNPTETEAMGQSRLASLLGSARPELFDAASTELKDLFTTDKYDPFSENGVYAGFKDEVNKATREGADALKRNAAFSRNLYSTDTIKNLGKVEQEGVRALNNKLAELYDTFAQRKLNAVPVAAQLGGAQEALDLGRIAAASTYGSLPRLLESEQAKDAYNEFVRTQNQQVGILGQVAGGPPQFGPSSYTMPASEGPWGKILDSLTKWGMSEWSKSWATA